MATKDKIASPFENQLLAHPGSSPKKGDAVNHNVTPAFSQPREHEDGEDETFFTAIDGENYYGSIEKKAAKVSTTMGGKR